jgi:hypothetical protein
VGVTAVMPRRSYTPLLGRLLHDRTADRMAAVVSQIPHAAATIVPFDVRSRVEILAERERAKAAPDGAGPAVTGEPAPVTAAEAPSAATGAGQDGQPPTRATDREPALGSQTPPEPPAHGRAEDADIRKYSRPRPSGAATPIGRLPRRGKATVEGRVHAVEIRPVEANTVLACEIVDATGQLTALFYGRSHIPGLDPGAKVRFTGQVGMRDDQAVMINPAYELLAPGEGDPPAS